jgi:hypothetical protein
MTSPDLIRELQQSRPMAPDSLRARVHELSAAPVARRRPWLTLPRPAFVLGPAAAALVLAIGTAGIIGLAGPGREKSAVADQSRLSPAHAEAPNTPAPTFGAEKSPQALGLSSSGSSAVAPTPDRAQDVEATLTVKVADSDRVSSAAQEALDLTRRLGGHVVSASVATGEDANAALTVRIPVAKTQEAVTRLSSLGKIVSQQVSIQDLQERLDSLLRRERSVRAQIVRISARLESEQLSAEERAALELRRHNLRNELRSLRRGVGSTRSEARFATIELSVVTPASEGVVVPPSRLGRSLDKALDVLVWEGIAALVVLLIAAPLAVLGVATWLARRIYRRHEDERLLATS